MTWNGKTWSKPMDIDPNGLYLVSVSCTSPYFCVAAGLFSNKLLMWDGESWAKTKSIDFNYGLYPLSAVSCSSSSFCVAMDTGGNALTWNGSSWSTPALIDQADDPFISCTSPRFCAVIGRGGNAVMWDGTTWSLPVNVDGSPLSISVSCASPNFCVAVDGAGNVITYSNSSKPVTLSSFRVRLGKSDANPATLYTQQSLSRVAVGQQVKLVIYGSMRGLLSGSINAPVVFMVVRGGKSRFAEKGSALLSPRDNGKRLVWSVFFTPRRPGKYIFSGTATVGRRYRRSIHFSVTQSQRG